MRPRTALIASIACGVVGITVVALDLQYTLTVVLEAKDDGVWRPVARYPYGDGRDYETPAGCQGPTMRLVVDNHRPIPADLRVEITFTNATTLRTTTVHDEVWDLPAFGSRAFEFTLPASAFEGPSRGDFVKSAQVLVRAGDAFLSACVGGGP